VRLHDRLGAVRLIVCCAGAGAAGLIVFSAAAGLPMLVIAALLVGAGAGPIDGAVNAHVALTRGVRSMGLLHASWALGAALGPGLVGLALALTASWRPAYVAMALLYVALGAAVWANRGGWRVAPPEAAVHAGARLPVGLTLVLVALVLYGGLEVSAGQWSFSALIAGGLLLIVFVVFQKIDGHPLVPLRVVADRNRGAGLVTLLLGPGGGLRTVPVLDLLLPGRAGLLADQDRTRVPADDGAGSRWSPR